MHFHSKQLIVKVCFAFLSLSFHFRNAYKMKQWKRVNIAVKPSLSARQTTVLEFGAEGLSQEALNLRLEELDDIHTERFR